jgi:Ca2+-binding RTX toxin-like protein
MKIKGTKGNDYLAGTDADDIVKGGKGDDVIDGSIGNDLLTGGKGRDTFIIRADQGLDIIADFQTGTDRIYIDDPLIGGGLLNPGGAAGPNDIPTIDQASVVYHNETVALVYPRLNLDDALII